MNPYEHEVVVVGARCAGAATALLLARQGHDVVMVDRASFPSDTLSTHAIARGGVVQLHRWGLLDEVLATGAPAIRTVSFHKADGTVERRTVKHRAGVDHLIAPRRYLLDTILVSAAIDAGVRFESGVQVTDVVRDRTGRATGVSGRGASGERLEYRGSFVVGADGLRSRVARAVGAGVVEERPSESAIFYTYVTGLDAEGFEFHLGDRAFTGVFPTNDGAANVWVCLPAEDAPTRSSERTDAFLALVDRTSPALGRRLRRSELVAPVRGAWRLPNIVRRPVGPGWALAGDAGYPRDPITGHGMTDAFRDAELLARHLGQALRGEVPEHVALAAYADEHHAALAPIFDVTCRLAALPPLDEFVALQKRLSQLIEVEARSLADLPTLPLPDAAAA